MRTPILFAFTLLFLVTTAEVGLADKREKDLAKCQQTIEKEASKQKQKEEASYGKCLKSVRKDVLEKGLAEPTDKTAQSCQKDLRKINDSRKIGKTHAEKSKKKMMSACDPAEKAFTHEDVLNDMHEGKPGLHGKNLEESCATQTSVTEMQTAEDLVDCVVESATKEAHEGIKKTAPKAATHLKDVSEKIKEQPDDAKDPSAKDDAAEAADKALESIDPDDDGVPNEISPFNAKTRVVFVTSVAYDGNFSGFVGANEECAGLAFTAGLPGRYMAWLSDGLVLAADALGDLTNNPTIPYARLDGTLVANTMFDFVGGGLLAPINVDELGGAQADEAVWTSSDAVGDNIIDNCSGYNSSDSIEDGHVGRTSLADAGWTDSGAQTCDQSARIYCIEVDSTP